MLHITDKGVAERPPLIILHGGPGYDHTPYKGFFEGLRNDVQIIYLDMHGNGRSDPGDPSSWNFDRWANDLNDFCQQLDLQNPIIFGHSFGSMVAMHFAIHYPKQLSKLILCNPIAKFELQKSAKKFEQLGGEKSKQAFLKFWTEGSEESKTDYSQYCAPHYGAQPIDEQAIFYNRLRLNMDIMQHFFTTLIHNFDALPKANKIIADTLILSGEKDPISLVETAEKLKQAIGDNASHHIVANTGHNLIWEDNAALVQQVVAFITPKS